MRGLFLSSNALTFNSVAARALTLGINPSQSI